MNKFRVVLVGIVSALACAEAIWADVPLANSSQMKKCLSSIADADVVLLDGAVTVYRVPGYEVKWNSSGLSPGLPEGIYGGGTFSSQRTLKGGVNNSSTPLRIVALIPFYEFRNTPNPNQEIVFVTVNGKPADCILLLPGQDIRSAIEAGLKSFEDNRLFNTQLSPDAPTLFIDAGTLNPSASLKIEYETKPRHYRVN